MTFDEIEVGMLIKGYGLVTQKYKAGTDEQLDHFWSGRNALTFFMFEDAHHGQCSTSFDDDFDFEQDIHRGTLEYMQAVEVMVKGRQEQIGYAIDDVSLLLDFQRGCVNTMNANVEGGE